jgi:hypothetical protein
MGNGIYRVVGIAVRIQELAAHGNILVQGASGRKLSVSPASYLVNRIGFEPQVCQKLASGAFAGFPGA